MLRNIEAERVRNGISKEKLSELIGVSPRTYFNWINEETDVPGVALVKMSLIFGTDVDYLMQGCTGVNPMDFVEKSNERG